MDKILNGQNPEFSLTNFKEKEIRINQLIVHSLLAYTVSTNKYK